MATKVIGKSKMICSMNETWMILILIWRTWSSAELHSVQMTSLSEYDEEGGPYVGRVGK
jgi:hypothetical protein